jgi:hypothetical protein
LGGGAEKALVESKNEFEIWRLGGGNGREIFLLVLATKFYACKSTRRGVTDGSFASFCFVVLFLQEDLRTSD